MGCAVRGIKVSGIEFQLGSLLESNHEMLAENPSWDLDAIERATGITCRRLARVEECASDLAVEAAEKLFAKGTVRREEIDALIVCTQSPDYLLPTTACIIQDRLGLSTTTASFDMNLGCSGYVYGLAVASSMIKSGLASKLLLLNADTYSKFVSKTDRTCRPIFADGAAASLVESTDGEDTVGPFDLGTNGRGSEKLILHGSGTRNTLSVKNADKTTARNSKISFLKMNGADVLMFTMNTVPKTVEALLKKAGVTKEQVDLYIFHQASRSVLDNIARHLNLPNEKVFRGFSEIGNTISASIPIAIKQAEEQGYLLPGQKVMLVGFGVGYSWGSCLLTWTRMK